MLTTGETITSALRLNNLGSDQWKQDAALREHARMLLTQLCGRTWTCAQHDFRSGSDTITILAHIGSGGMSSDFASLGTKGHVYIPGRVPPLRYLPRDEYNAAIESLDGAEAAEPWGYTLDTQITGIPILKIVPVNSIAITLDVLGYNRRVPELVDIPIAPTVAAGAVGNPNGDYTYRVVFKMGILTTEGGIPSVSVALANKKGVLTAIPVSPCRSVTAREIYRPPVNDPYQYALVGSLNDNLTLTYVDDILDVNLGDDIPLPAAASTGMEFFPGDWHESFFVDGLTALLKRAQGDGQVQDYYTKEWERGVRRMWADQAQGQNFSRVMPRYGQPANLGQTLSRMRFRGV